MKIKVIILILLAYTVVSCHSNHQHDEHLEDEELKFQITEYTKAFELFAEADVFVVGKESNILSHFTRIPEFLPLKDTKVRLKLIVGDNGIQQTLDAETRLGIYSFYITPDKSGNAKIIIEILEKEKVHTIQIENIIVYSSEEEAHEQFVSEEVSLTNTTIFTKEQSWKLDFSTDFPLVEPFGQVIKTTGLVQASQSDELVVTAKTDGIVMFANDNLFEGVELKKSQLLFSVSANEFANNNIGVQYLEAQNNYNRTKSDYERLQSLFEDKIVTEGELLAAENKYYNAKAQYDNLKNNFSVSGQNAYSSTNAYIKQVHVQNGGYVTAGQQILTLIQNKNIVLFAEVQQKYFPILSSITSINIRTLHDNRIQKVETLNENSVTYGKSVGNDNYLVPVTIQVDNLNMLLQGSFVELFLRTETNSNALTIPSTALLEEQGVFYVFVQVNPELFEKREVGIGFTDGIRTEVIKGLDKNERIVTVGAMQIKLAQATGALDPHSGHAH